MNESMLKCLSGVRFGEAQLYRRTAVYPLLGDDGKGPVYITLGEAMEGRLITVSEVSKGGSVPELMVTSKATLPVFMLDGEELAGAKQNRVLNTTVLVPAGGSIVIPVSCTEQGRWSYAAPVFHESGHVMARHARARKMQSVSEALACRASFDSNQGQVWSDIHAMQRASRACSPTSAMRDVYQAKQADLDGAMAAFPLLAEQAGLLVLQDGHPVGMDLLSRPAAYARLHCKLAKSYVMDSLLSPSTGGEGGQADIEASARAFLTAALGCNEQRFKSVGLGEDHRYRNGVVAGSALLYEDTVVHTAFFRVEGGEQEIPISRSSHRRAFRLG